MTTETKRFHAAWWEIRDNDGDDPPHWYGGGAGDTEATTLSPTEALVMYPKDFPVGTRVDVEEPEDHAFYDRLWVERDENIKRWREGERDPRARVRELEAALADATARAERAEKRNHVWFDAGFAPPVRPGDMKRFLVTVANPRGQPFVAIGCYGDKVVSALDEEITGWFQDIDDEYAPPLEGVLAWAHLPAPFLAANLDAPATGTISEAVDTIREAGGKAWNNIADPEKYLGRKDEPATGRDVELLQRVVVELSKFVDSELLKIDPIREAVYVAAQNDAEDWKRLEVLLGIAPKTGVGA